MEKKSFIWVIVLLLITVVVVFIILSLVGVGDDSNSDEVGDSGVGDGEAYYCTADTYNCGDFESYEEALEVYDICGGVDNDVHRLDNDGDGEPCEGLK
jgi:hypothetical protein